MKLAGFHENFIDELRLGLFLLVSECCRWQLMVKGPLGPYMANGPRDRRLEAGQSIQLTCRVVGNPWPHVRWFKDQDQIIPDGRDTSTV